MSDPVIGLDIRGDGCCVARVRTDNGSALVESLQCVASADSLTPLLAGGRSVLAVPDRNVIVKTIPPPQIQNVAVADLVRFELGRTLLDDEAEFAFDYAQAGTDGRLLGLGYRRAYLRQICRPWGLDDESVDRVRFRSRALALGRGYLAHCERDPGDLVALADLNPPAVSICMIYRDSVVDLAWLDITALDLAAPADRERFAVDLKTMLNFRRGSLRDSGISMPLAALIVTGDLAVDQMQPTLQQYFPSGILVPRLRPALFSDPESAASDAALRFLVALGLAAN